MQILFKYCLPGPLAGSGASTVQFVLRTVQAAAAEPAPGRLGSWIVQFVLTIVLAGAAEPARGRPGGWTGRFVLTIVLAGAQSGARGGAPPESSAARHRRAPGCGHPRAPGCALASARCTFFARVVPERTIFWKVSTQKCNWTVDVAQR